MMDSRLRKVAVRENEFVPRMRSVYNIYCVVYEISMFGVVEVRGTYITSRSYDHIDPAHHVNTRYCIAYSRDESQLAWPLFTNFMLHAMVQLKVFAQTE